MNSPVALLISAGSEGSNDPLIRAVLTGHRYGEIERRSKKRRTIKLGDYLPLDRRDLLR